MEMPFHLRTIPVASLDILRYFGTLDGAAGHFNDVMQGSGLSENLFGKAISRLVTKGYLQVDEDQIYSLTEQGQDSVRELAAYDASLSGDDSATANPIDGDAAASGNSGEVVELPFALRTLPPEALTVMRHMADLPEPNIHYDDLFDQLELGERTFGKVMRRLVTKGYVNMVEDQIYALSDRGNIAVQDIAEYDNAIDAGAVDAYDNSVTADTVSRRMVLVLPERLVARRPANIFIGFNAADGDNTLPEETDVVVRTVVINGEPSSANDNAITLQNDAAHVALPITPGLYSRVRIRLEVFQLWPNPEDISPVGGMYVDVDVHADGDVSPSKTAYGIDLDLNV